MGSGWTSDMVTLKAIIDDNAEGVHCDVMRIIVMTGLLHGDVLDVLKRLVDTKRVKAEVRERRVVWTANPNAARDLAIAAAALEGRTVRDLGDEHGISHNYASKITRSLGLPDRRKGNGVGFAKARAVRRTNADARGEKAYALRMAGHVWSEIASKLGYKNKQSAITCVCLHALRNGKEWPVRSDAIEQIGSFGKKMPDREEEIVAALKAGATQTALAKKYGVTRQRMSQISRRNGIDRKHDRSHVEYRRGPLVERVTVHCGNCGKPTEMLPSMLAQAKRRGQKAIYCSKKCHGLDARINDGEAAYNLRLQGYKWIEISEKTGIKSGPVACCTAKRYAEKNGKRWPLHRKPRRKRK